MARISYAWLHVENGFSMYDSMNGVLKMSKFAHLLNQE
jgi:hypothetical protein